MPIFVSLWERKYDSPTAGLRASRQLLELAIKPIYSAGICGASVITVTLWGRGNQFPEDDIFLLLCCSQVVGSFCPGAKHFLKMLSPGTAPLREGTLEEEVSWATPSQPLLQNREVSEAKRGSPLRHKGGAGEQG